MSETYKIAIPNNIYKRWISSSKATGKANGRTLPSTCLGEISYLMREEEHINLRLKYKNPFIYPKCKKDGTAFIRINGYCSQCRHFDDNNTKNGAYLITALQNPINQDEPHDPEKDDDFAQCTVVYSPHVHVKPAKIITMVVTV
jgi:hypothetical protein